MPTPTAGFSPPGPPWPQPDMSGPELVFLHIPKTAGTSQQNAFNEYCGPDNVFWIGKHCPPGVRRYPRALVGERLIVGGHKPLSFYPRGLDPLYSAILRDPVARAISLFAFYTRPDLAVSRRDEKARAGLLEQYLAKGIDPDSMLNSIRNCRSFRREISNLQCRYLSRKRATFADVRKSLRDCDHLIGTMAHHELFRRELWQLLDWTEEAPAKVNRGRDNYADAYLQDAELVQLIAELNDEDRQLVEFVETEHQGLWLNLKDGARRRRRLRGLPITPGRRRVRLPDWEEAPEFWPPRGAGKLRWPLNRAMVAQPCRLLYMSTPGAADRVVQRMMLRLSSIDHKDALLAFGMERVLEQFSTGLLLDDLEMTEIQAILASGDYFKFAIVYEPVARLVNVYAQRFFELRDMLPQWPRLHQLVADVQGRAVPDCAAGISFRQFVSAVTAPQGDHKHWLWRSQSRYLPGSDNYDRLYRADRLHLLEADLQGVRGVSVTLEAVAADQLLTTTAATCPQVEGGLYADIPAGDLPHDPACWRDQLVDEALLELIKGYYARDFTLYNRTADKELEVARK